MRIPLFTKTVWLEDDVMVLIEGKTLETSVNTADARGHNGRLRLLRGPAYVGLDYMQNLRAELMRPQ